jgi:hypothetical protein
MKETRKSEVVLGATMVREIKRIQGTWPEIVQRATKIYGPRGAFMARLLECKVGSTPKAGIVSFLEREGFNVEKLLKQAGQRNTFQGLRSTLQALTDWLAEDICPNVLKEGSCLEKDVCSLKHP